MSVLVVNRKHYTGDGIYIGRAMPRYGLAASPLANPYHIGRDGTREEVIEKYGTWLRQRFQTAQAGTPTAAWAAFIELTVLYHTTCFFVDGGATGAHITLICWCKELGKDVPCHGDVLKEWLEGRLAG